MVIWKQWKRVKTRLKDLVRLGVKESKAWEWAKTRKGYWRTAGSAILSSTITNERLSQAGYVSLSNYYQNVNQNLKNRPVPNGTQGGVRGRIGKYSLSFYSIDSLSLNQQLNWLNKHDFRKF